MEKEKTCFFTGHRDIPSSDERDIFLKVSGLIEQLYQDGFRNFIAGGAIGFDTLAAKAVIAAKEEHPDIRLHICIPCKGQDKYFSPEQKAEYSLILSISDSAEVLYEHYVRGCMQTRNRRMVDLSSVGIAYCTRPTGGTAYTVSYAEKKDVKIFHV